MKKVFTGDILERRNGEKYILAMTSTNKFQLIGIEKACGNRWRDEQIYSSGKENCEAFVYLDELLYRSGRFGNINDVKVYSGKEFSLQPFENKEPKPPQKEEPAQLEHVSEIIISEIDIERVIAHKMLFIKENALPSAMVEEFASAVFDLLIEKGIVEEE